MCGLTGFLGVCLVFVVFNKELFSQAAEKDIAITSCFGPELGVTFFMLTLVSIDPFFFSP